MEMAETTELVCVVIT